MITTIPIWTFANQNRNADTKEKTGTTAVIETGHIVKGRENQRNGVIEMREDDPSGRKDFACGRRSS